MSIRKISNPEFYQQKQCRHPDHDFSQMTHWCPEPGTYENTCPACGHKTIFVQPGWTMMRWEPFIPLQVTCSTLF